MSVQRIHLANTLELQALYASFGKVGTTSNFYTHDRDEKGLRVFKEGTEEYHEVIKKVSQVTYENIPSLRREWTTSVAGAFPSVPKFLAGEPESMWRMCNIESNYSPLRIWIGTGSSSGIEYPLLLQKFITIVAFAQALSEIRPVFLTPYFASGNYSYTDSKNDVIVSWDLQTSPMILSEIAASLCEIRVTRGVLFNLREFLLGKWDGQWAYRVNDEDYMREQLGAEPDDLWLGSSRLGDPLLTDPIKWVKAHIAKYLLEDEREESRFR